MENLLKLQNGSDVRGIALPGVAGENVNLTQNSAGRIGAAFAKWLSQRTGASVKIGIGMDSRLSGPSLEEAAVSGMIAGGAKVVRCGLATTPAMFMSTVFPETNFDGSVMITASHLPFNRNGLKFFDRNGGLEHDDITQILEIAGGEDESIDAAKVEACEKFNLLALYSSHLKNSICKELGKSENERPLSGLKIVVDAGNGCGGFFAKILDELGADTRGSSFLDPDGHFPNHIPNPENKEAMAAIQSATVKNSADLGLIFDTDVDRMSCVLSNGDEVNRDAIIALVSAILAPDYPGSTIITDSVTSDRLTRFLEDVLKLRHLRYMRGYKNVINKCIELNSSGTVSPLAMETSGHGALKDNYYLDDGAFLATRLVASLAKMKAQGKNLGDLISGLPPLVEEWEGRFKIQCDNFKEYGESVLAEFKKRAQEKNYAMPESFEGIRLSFDGNGAGAKGWILLRMSLHDPVMPMNIESEEKGGIEKLKAVAKELIAGFDKLDLPGF